MRLLFLIFSLLMLIACAPKVKKECIYDEMSLQKYRDKSIPESFKIYGLLKYGPLKFPMMLAKEEGHYIVKVARAKGLKLTRDKFCIKNKCYLLPAPPEELIFGRLLSGREYSFCREGLLYFRHRGAVYERVVVFEGNRVKELSIVHRKKNRGVKVLLIEESPSGYFKELEFLMDNASVKLLVEEVEM